MGQLPTVSVVMCTYNGGQYVDEQIKSIVEQDADINEFIIVDDRSTDNTWGKLIAWQQKHSFVKLYRNEENLGYNKNFEKAIQLAKSELIALADQDDIWLPQKISRLLPAFSDPTVMLAHSRSVLLKNGYLDYKITRFQHHFSGSDVRHFFFFNHVMGHDTVFRASLVQYIVPLPTGMSYDWWIAVHAIARGKIISVPEFLVHQRIHTANNFFSRTNASKKKELDLDETLSLIATITALQPADKHFLQTFISLLHQKIAMPDGSFSKPLFRFLYKNRRIFFGHKRRLFPEIAYLKSALKYARFNYRGKGMSI